MEDSQIPDLPKDYFLLNEGYRSAVIEGKCDPITEGSIMIPIHECSAHINS